MQNQCDIDYDKEHQVTELVRVLELCRKDYIASIQATEYSFIIGEMQGKSGISERIAKDNKLAVLNAMLERINYAISKHGFIKGE